MGPLREALMQGIDINKLRKEEMRPVVLQVSDGSFSQQLDRTLGVYWKFLKFFSVCLN
jgi:Mg-chelatase subunit ChlD